MCNLTLHAINTFKLQYMQWNTHCFLHTINVMMIHIIIAHNKIGIEREREREGITSKVKISTYNNIHTYYISQ